MSDEAAEAVQTVPEDDASPAPTWEERAAAALGIEPVLVVEARSERSDPVKGPVMLAVAAGRIAVLPGERNGSPPSDAPPATVMWFDDILKPPAVRPRKHGATVELKTANAEVRVAAPLSALHAIVDAFGAPAIVAATTATVPPATTAISTAPTAISATATATSAPPAAAGLPAPVAAPALPPAPAALPPPRRAPAGYDVRDGFLVPRRQPNVDPAPAPAPAPAPEE